MADARQEGKLRSLTGLFLILILITAVLYSAPSRKSTQKRSQPNLFVSHRHS